MKLNMQSKLNIEWRLHIKSRFKMESKIGMINKLDIENKSAWKESGHQNKSLMDCKIDMKNKIFCGKQSKHRKNSQHGKKA